VERRRVAHRDEQTLWAQKTSGNLGPRLRSGLVDRL